MLLEQGGFLYDSNAYNDDMPITMRIGDAAHVVLPYAFDTNDMRFANGGGFVLGSDFARYCADARARELPLVGGGDHDWAHILTRWDALHRDLAVAEALRTAGWACLAAAAAWVAWRWRADRADA